MLPPSVILVCILPFAYATTHVIGVGDGGLVFKPDSITAAAGDMLEFQFYPAEHNVIQGSFSQPCQPVNSSAFYSGYMPVSSGPGSKTFTVMVNDTNPVWFYCSVGSHCQSGMVGVVNPPSDNSMTLAGYKSASSSATSKTPSVVQGGVVAALSSGSSTSSASTSAMSSSMSGTATTTISGSNTMTSATATSSASPTTTAKSGGEMANKTATWGVLAAGLLTALFTTQMI
ncbi:MAG: hypothetical protein FRX48_05513 [Lasallia pustulata]|uniref:Phytocyanin domain-containing protein n=1 Tax=Lasallia pustulata TaxID=136370 RepID=A0A5M8PN17_9LECA|nr:MAG: hypothetical protein FRX48_05513 [Lasallia pustulata]